MSTEFKDIANDFLTPPDPLIVSAKKNLTRKEATSYNHVGMVECKGDELEIRVSPENIDRALRFMDVLIKTMRTRQYEIKIHNGDTYAIVKGYDIKIRCHELSRRVVANDRRFSSSELHPTGLLSFKAGNFTPKEWKDSAKDAARKLETMLPDIIAWLEKEADYWNAIWAENDLQRKAKEKEQEAEEALLEKKRLELVAFDELLANSERRVKVAALREYIDAREKQGAEPEWVAWARKKADWYDPFVGREDEVLGKYGVG